MSFPYPRVAFKFSIGEQTVRAFGECDQVERSVGFTPNLTQIRFPKSQFDLFVGDYTRHGDIELYFGEHAPDAPDVVLAGYWVDFVEDTLIGRPLGDGGPAIVLEKTLTLSDRRWEFTDGMGGTAHYGVINQVKPDGTGVTNPAASQWRTAGETYGAILSALFHDIKYDSGLPRYVGMYNDAQTEKPPFNDTKPREVKADGVHIPTLTQKLLDDCEATLCLKNDGTYQVWLLGEGDLPALNADLLIPTENYQPRSNRPEKVVITSAPRRIMCEKIFTGDLTSDWEWVGLETDSSYKPLGTVSYLGLLTAIDVIQSQYAILLANLDQYERAKLSFYRMLRIKPASLAKYGPLLQYLPRTVDDDATHKRPLPGVRVRAMRAVQSEDGRWQNSDQLIETADVQVDSVHGVISTPVPLGRVTSNGVSSLYASFVPISLLNSSLEITISHECKENQIVPEGQEVTKPWRDYFCAGFNLNANGQPEQLSDAATDAAMDPSATKVKIISLPSLVAYRNNAGVITNLAELNAEAKKAAARALALQAVPARTYKYKGFQNVDCSGNILSVRWKLKEGITEFDYRTFFISKNRYLDRKAFAQVKANASGGAATAAAASPGVQAGSRDFAQPSQTLPCRPLPSPGGSSIRYGRYIERAVPNNTNLLKLRPCKADGSVIDATGAGDIVAAACLPLSQQPSVQGLVANCLLAFVMLPAPHPDNATVVAMIVGLNLGLPAVGSEAQVLETRSGVWIAGDARWRK